MKTLLACLLCAALPGLALASQEKVISVYNWNDYIDPQVLIDFEQQTGIHVDYKTFSSTDELLGAVERGEPFDVIVPSNDNLPALIQGGKLLPLDQARLPNSQHLDKQILNKLAAFDPRNRYAIPYLWGSIGLAINTPQAEAALGGPVPQSWSLLFDPDQSAKLASCGLSMLDAATDVTTLVMNYKGRALADSSPRQIQKAGETLMLVRPNLRMIDSELYIDELNNGSLCVALAYVGDALNAAAAGQPVEFVVPEEGSVMFVDSMVIPANAKRPDLALQFLDYMMQPEVAAKITSETLYPNANADSAQFLSAELRAQPGITLDKETRRRLSLMPELGAATTAQVDAQWAAFKDAAPAPATAKAP
ncbi:extracellular solute-binding protein [Pseudomonas sp. N040]|uniref:extracellular solute-binding protein n=1 Tax=Pseudomonas sp. N040 TaxID=2785325 RepID=UPI0018A2C330|nr:extracellular solute-binding protein [Pseudomonas sp. N040]MBF7730040.1 extracellular solute-binding protein [Pseudomonas sp. N040]MBW7013682.1 extracellular solute-binding protein [Pseudomonas sp. N040]